MIISWEQIQPEPFTLHSFNNNKEPPKNLLFPHSILTSWKKNNFICVYIKNQQQLIPKYRVWRVGAPKIQCLRNVWPLLLDTTGCPIVPRSCPTRVGGKEALFVLYTFAWHSLFVFPLRFRYFWSGQLLFAQCVILRVHRSHGLGFFFSV